MATFTKLSALAAAGLALLASVATAQELNEPSAERFERWGNYSDKMEVRLGASSYDTGLFSRQRFSGVNINGELLFRSPEFLAFIGAPRPYVGFNAAITQDPDRPVNFAYAGLSWDYNITRKLYVSGSLGGAIHDASNLINPVNYKGLGCRALFHLGAAVGYDVTPSVTVQAYADHFSNANLCKENDGAESAGVRVGFRF